MTIMAVVIINRFSRGTILKSIPPVKYSQSHIHNLTYPFMPDNEDIVSSRPKTQSEKHFDTLVQRVAFTDDKAYWIANNAFYVAEAIDGEVVEESKQKVDTMTMSKVELEQMSYIIEQLVGDENDNWNPRQQSF
jgi:hypothetical protein